MPTNANSHPFRAPGKVTADDLLRYARGAGDARERHRIEQHLLADPLLAEAAEGLQKAGAAEGWAQLRGSRNTGSHWHTLAWSVAALAVVGGVFWISLSREEATSSSLAKTMQEQPDTTRMMPTPPTTRVVVPEEVSSAIQTVSIPLLEVYARDREKGDVLVVQGRPIEVPTSARSEPAPLGPPRKRSSRQLVFLHDMKLVHPDELYRDKPPTLFGLGVPAFAENAADTARWRNDVRDGVEPYLAFFEAVMAHIAKQEDSEALKELGEILGQYPDDVNALFYAGYSAYRAGGYERAIGSLHRAAVHPVDTFLEEAEWYEALALLEGRGIESALPALRKIQEEQGFYSERASALIGLVNGTPSGSR